MKGYKGKVEAHSRHSFHLCEGGKLSVGEISSSGTVVIDIGNEEVNISLFIQPNDAARLADMLANFLTTHDPLCEGEAEITNPVLGPVETLPKLN